MLQGLGHPTNHHKQRKVMAKVLYECQESIKPIFPALELVKFERAFSFLLNSLSASIILSCLCNCKVKITKDNNPRGLNTATPPLQKFIHEKYAKIISERWFRSIKSKEILS